MDFCSCITLYFYIFKEGILFYFFIKTGIYKKVVYSCFLLASLLPSINVNDPTVKEWRTNFGYDRTNSHKLRSSCRNEKISKTQLFEFGMTPKVSNFDFWSVRIVQISDSVVQIHSNYVLNDDIDKLLVVSVLRMGGAGLTSFQPYPQVFKRVKKFNSVQIVRIVVQNPIKYVLNVGYYVSVQNFWMGGAG